LLFDSGCGISLPILLGTNSLNGGRDECPAPFVHCHNSISSGCPLLCSYISRKLGEDPGHPTPAVTFNDGRDYVPTRNYIVFAHHFSAIAGAGPILGPTMALLYGYLPAWLWIVFGGIFIGAVHDFQLSLSA